MILAVAAVFMLLVGCSSTTSQQSTFLDLVHGRYDVSHVDLPDAEKAAYLNAGIPFQCSLLLPDFETLYNATRTVQRRLRVSEEFRVVALSRPVADEAALHALHIFKTTPVLSSLDLSTYVCQMVGLSLSERPCVVLNFLGVVDPGWECRFDYYFDGGPQFVQMLYDVASKRITRLKVNGCF